MLIEQFIEITEPVCDPSAERRPVIVHEKASVFDLRLMRHDREFSVIENNFLINQRLHISEIMPGAYAYHLREVV